MQKCSAALAILLLLGWASSAGSAQYAPGDIVFADSRGMVMRIDGRGALSTISAHGYGMVRSVVVTPDNRGIHVAVAHRLLEITPGGTVVQSASFTGWVGDNLAVDGAGSLILGTSSSATRRVMKVAHGRVTTLFQYGAPAGLLCTHVQGRGRVFAHRAGRSGASRRAALDQIPAMSFSTAASRRAALA